jgi:putative intracellular protease/amidase
MKTEKATHGIALFWDESFLWGVMAAKALADAGLPFHLITAKEIADGGLNHHLALLVPGGWASNKLTALGETGIARLRRFVENGGTYVGICGGAGLATNDGLRLIDVKRVPTAQRVPSFSGRIRLTLTAHPLWDGIDDPLFYVWWPSQFAIGEDVTVLARYDEALPDAFSSDLNVGDVLTTGGWADWETRYGINLDPSRMRGLPAVVTAKYGKGDVLVSLLHFDTPGDSNGTIALKNLWAAVTGAEALVTASRQTHAERGALPPLAEASPPLGALAAELCEAVDGLMELGRRNFLWFDREPSMLQWKRGVRGLEYYSLKVMADEIVELIGNSHSAISFRGSGGNQSREEMDRFAESARERLGLLREKLLPFIHDARHLLVLERQEMSHQRLTYAEAKDPRVLSLRDSLFSSKKSHGGLFKEVAEQMSDLIRSLITRKILPER